MSVFYFLGYTINRVTLFALIFSMAFLSMTPLSCRKHGSPLSVAGESWPADEWSCGGSGGRGWQSNHSGHFRRDCRGTADGLCPRLDGALHATHSVGASAAMLFSLLVAFVVRPGQHSGSLAGIWKGPRYWSRRLRTGGPGSIRRIMTPLIQSPRNRVLFFLGVLVLFFGLSGACTARTRESEDVAVRQQERVAGGHQHARWHSPGADGARGPGVGGRTCTAAEVLNYQTYTGTSGPYNFNGLVRHYYMRRQPNQPTSSQSVPASNAASRAMDCKTASSVARCGRQRVWCAHSSQRGSTGAASGADIGGRGLRSRPGWSDQVAQQIKTIFQHTQG